MHASSRGWSNVEARGSQAFGMRRWPASLPEEMSSRGKKKGKQWWDGGALYLFDRHQQLIESPCMYVLRDFESCSRYSSPATITWLAAKEVKSTFLRAAILVLKLQTSNDHSFCCEFSPMTNWKTIHQHWFISSPPAVQNGGDCGCYFYEESNLVVIGLWWLALP